jgi:hypothetical protein
MLVRDPTLQAPTKRDPASSARTSRRIRPRIPTTDHRPVILSYPSNRKRQFDSMALSTDVALAPWPTGNEAGPLPLPSLGPLTCGGCNETHHGRAALALIRSADADASDQERPSLAPTYQAEATNETEERAVRRLVKKIRTTAARASPR